MDRRTFLRGAVIAASAPVVVNEVKQFDMGHFLATASPAELVTYHLGAAAEAMNLLRPQDGHVVRMDMKLGMAMIVPFV